MRSRNGVLRSVCQKNAASASLGRIRERAVAGQSDDLVGAGETVELAARHLSANGLGRMIIANRTLESAHRLASEFGGYAIELGEIPGVSEAPGERLAFLPIDTQEGAPIEPADDIVANVNLDSGVFLYDFVDIIPFGTAYSTLDGNVRRVAAALGLGAAAAWVTQEAWQDIYAIAMADEESSHILLVPLVAAWMLWVRAIRLRLCAARPSLIGPAIVEEPEATTFLGPGERATVHPSGALEVSW